MLVVLSVVEQRLDAVRLVLSGVPLVEVAERVGGASVDAASVGGPVFDGSGGRVGGSVASSAFSAWAGARGGGDRGR
ncbi:MAG TPA: hypothetical protein VLL82_01250 [Mycobacterium sp.]|nr:hypothetical protein [Mycobacterium sp.]